MTIWATKVNIHSPAMPDDGVNTWHMREDAAFPIDSRAAVEDMMVWVSVFYEGIKGVYTPDTVLSWDGEATEVGSEDPKFHSGMTAWSKTGTGGSNAMPPADQMLVKWSTASASRSGKGRTFIGPLSEDNLQSNGTPEESNRSVIQGAADALISTSEAADAESQAIGIWSVKDGVLRDITGASVPNKFASLRSRRD